MLVHRARYYQSKAILGAAHSFATGKPLTSGEFSGGTTHTVRLLTGLGFEVVDKPMDDWALWPRLDDDATILAHLFPGWRRWADRYGFPELSWPGVYVPR